MGQKMNQIDFPFEGSDEKWIELFPYGVTMAADRLRPIMLFKDKLEQQVLPVFLSPIEAGLVVNHTQESLVATSPHHLTSKILGNLGVKLKKVHFTDVRGSLQYIDLHFKGSTRLKTIESRADEAISFCLSEDAQFFCRPSYFRKCRELEGEMTQTMVISAMHNEFNETPQYLN